VHSAAISFRRAAQRILTRDTSAYRLAWTDSLSQLIDAPKPAESGNGGEESRNSRQAEHGFAQFDAAI
jgi:hypothetical protein